MHAIMAFYAENYKESEKIFTYLYGNCLQSAFFLLISKADEGKRREKEII